MARVPLLGSPGSLDMSHAAATLGLPSPSLDNPSVHLHQAPVPWYCPLVPGRSQGSTASMEPGSGGPGQKECVVPVRPPGPVLAQCRRCPCRSQCVPWHRVCGSRWRLWRVFPGSGRGHKDLTAGLPGWTGKDQNPRGPCGTFFGLWPGPPGPIWVTEWPKATVSGCPRSHPAVFHGWEQQSRWPGRPGGGGRGVWPWSLPGWVSWGSDRQGPSCMRCADGDVGSPCCHWP